VFRSKFKPSTGMKASEHWHLRREGNKKEGKEMRSRSVKVTLRLTVCPSCCWAPCGGHHQILVISLIFTVFVAVGRPLWREVGYVISQEVLVSVSVLYSHTHTHTHTHISLYIIRTVYRVPVIPGVVQQIMQYLPAVHRSPVDLSKESCGNARFRERK
jgi:hypothetical protein